MCLRRAQGRHLPTISGTLRLYSAELEYREQSDQMGEATGTCNGSTATLENMETSWRRALLGTVAILYTKVATYFLLKAGVMKISCLRFSTEIKIKSILVQIIVCEAL